MRYMIIPAMLAASLLAGCATEQTRPPASYGAPSNFRGMAPNTGMQNFRGTSGWSATDENFRPATPAPFKGF